MVDTRNRRHVPLLPLRGLHVFPSMVIYLDVGRAKSVQALERAMEDDQQIVLATQKEISIDDPTEEDIFSTGTLSQIKNMLRLPNGTVRVHVEGLKRAKIEKFHINDDYIAVDVEVIEEDEKVTTELEAMTRNLLSMFEQYSKI